MLRMSLALLGALSLSGQTSQPVINSIGAYGPNLNALAPAQYAQVRGTGLGGSATRVTLNGAVCEVFFATDTAIGIQVPASTVTGRASVIVETSGRSSAPFSITINPTAPLLLNLFFQGPAKPPSLFQFGPGGGVIPTPSPGDRVYISVDGLGAPSPPLPRVQIDGNDVTILASDAFGYTIDGPASRIRPFPVFLIQIPQVNGGPHSLTLIAGGVTSRAVQFTVIASGLILSQTGLTFSAIQGGPPLPAQTISILSGSGTLSFSLATSTLSGGGWLQATPAAGSATFGNAGSLIQVRADPAGLAAATYYGQITISSPDVTNSPQTVTIVLNVVPPGTRLGPSTDRTGLIFVGAPGGSDPPAQAVNVFNPLAGVVGFTSTIQATGANPFAAGATTGSIQAGQSLAIQIRASLTGRPVGTNTAQLRLSFSDGSLRIISLLLVVAPGASNSASAFRSINTQCVPTKLLPVFTLVGDSFTVAAAWPTPVAANIVDDCGNPLDTGSVRLAFSNGDPPLRLTPILNGAWSATWPPSNARPSGIVLTLTAERQEAPKITGSAQVTGGVTENPNVPEVRPGGVVETASYNAPVAPGDLIAIFGAKLASEVSGAQSLPLPSQLLSTSVVLGGRQLPLIYASNGQVNAMVPYDLTLNAQYQIVVRRGSSYSVPQSVPIGVARPAVFTIDSSGQGQGHIYKYDAGGNQILVDKTAPAKPGEALVIYCAGLGAVTPPVAAGAQAPLTSLTNTANPVTVVIGGRSARILFAGLTPGFTGLYQVNAIVPEGLTDNEATPLQLLVAGETSATVVLAVRN